jgi:hypothetical protein
MEYSPQHRVDEAHMNEDYRKKEAAFRSEAAKLWEEEKNARARIRAGVGLSDEERQDLYMQSYQGLQQRLDSLSDEFGRDVTRIVEFADGGYSPVVIASSVGLTEEFVREVLERAEEVRNDAPPAG